MTTSSMSSFQWKIITLMTWITMVNFIDRSSISFTIGDLKAEFGMNNAEFGIIAGAFGVGYMITTIIGGIIVDRFGTIGTWAIGAILWSFAMMFLGLCEGFWSFFYLRVFLGLAEGIHFPALLRTVTDWLPGLWRARATSLSLSGVPFASILGAPLVTYLMVLFNWRVMFVILGAIGILWAVCWLFLFRHHPKVRFSSVGTSSVSQQKGLWKPMLRNGNLLLTCLIYFAFGSTVFFVLMWLPGYLVQIHNASTLNTGYLVLPPWICSALFLLLGGWLSDYLFERTGSVRKARSFVIGMCFLLSGLCFLGVVFSELLFSQLIWMSLGLGFSFAANAPVYALLADLFGHSVGIAQGIISFFFALASIVSPMLIGWIAHVTGEFQLVFYMLTALSVTSALLLLVFQRPKISVS